MYKVLLIDDEPWILKDMELLVDWASLGFKIVAKISDPEQAIYLIKEQRPDLVICDIKMPGLNGIELIKMVKKRFNDLFVVFLSAYSEFSYAKQAIALGAFDYILKPIEKSELTDLLLRIRSKLKKDEEQKNKLLRYRSSELFLELIEGRPDSGMIKSKLRQIGYELPYENYLIAVVDFIDDNNLKSWQSDMQDCFPSCRLVFFQLGEQKWVVLFNYNNSSFIENQPCLNDLKIITDRYNLLIGCSNNFSDLTLIKHYYKQAELMAYSYYIYKKRGIYLYSQYNNNYKELLIAIKGLTTPDDFKNLLKELPGIIIDKQVNLEEIAYLYNQLREKANIFFNLDSELELLDPLDIVYSFNNLEELFAQLADFIISENNFSGVSHDIIERILDQIAEKYDQDLRLQDLADKYHLNYNYLSQLFKKETGQTFTNYLVELRIEKAIELFSKDLLFYEIAKRVGYSDYYHFCKIFKKHKGMNPSEFKKAYID